MAPVFSPYSVAVVTPFEADGSLVEFSVRAHLERLASLEVPAFLVSGSTGEQHSMSVAERSELYRWAVAATDRPVYAGVAAVRTSDAVTLARAAEVAGARGIMLGFPPYVRLTSLDARAYVRAVCAVTGLPILVYNNPLRTAFDLLPEVLEALVAENPSIRAVKETGDSSRARGIKAALGADFQVFSGSDRLIADSWDQGYDGLTSIAGNLWPREVAQIMTALQSGRLAEARELLGRMSGLYQAVTEPQLPSSLKHGLRFLGLPGGWAREPLGHLDPTVLAGIERALKP